MRNTVYRVGFGLVALCVVTQLALWPLMKLGVQFPLGSWLPLLELFGQPVPAMLRHMLPRLLVSALYWVFAVLVLRRLWIFAQQRAFVAPAAFTTFPYALMSIAVLCVLLFALALGVTVALKAGSGVPAAMLLIPAGLLLTPSVALTEVLSLVLKPAEFEATLPGNQ